MTARNYLCTRNFSELQEFPKGFVYQFLKNIYENSDSNYVVGQGERGTQNKILHIQFYVNFKVPQRFTKITKIDKSIHCEKVYVNNGADRYCMKKETRVDGPYKFGNYPMKFNDPNDWQNIWNLAKENRIEEIPPGIRIRNYNTIKTIAKDYMNLEDCEHLRGIWIWGPAGTGKSRWVREHVPPHDLYPKMLNKWWDGYNNQRVVVLDDFGLEGDFLSQELKIWSDRYGCLLENKGGCLQSNYEWFIITSQYRIEDIFTDFETREALHRRFIVFFIDDLLVSNFSI